MLRKDNSVSRRQFGGVGENRSQTGGLEFGLEPESRGNIQEAQLRKRWADSKSWTSKLEEGLSSG